MHNSEVVHDMECFTEGSLGESFLSNFTTKVYQNTPIQEFKRSFSEAAKSSRNTGKVDSAIRLKIQLSFRSVLSYVNGLRYHTSSYTAEQREEIGNWIHQEFIAFCLLGSWPSRSLNKP